MAGNEDKSKKEQRKPMTISIYPSMESRLDAVVRPNKRSELIRRLIDDYLKSLGK